MKIGSWFTVSAVLSLTFTIFACREAPPIGDSPDSPAQIPTVNTPSVDPTNTMAAPLIPDSTVTAAATAGDTLVGSDLSEADVLQIIRSSFATYPWRMNQSVLNKGTGQTSTTLTEAQSSTRGYNQSVQTVGADTVTIESMLIESTVYLKVAGSGVAETYGLTEGQWVEVTPDSPLAQLTDPGAVDPARITETFTAEFAALKGESNMDNLVFSLVGTEDVNGVQTNVYESTGATFTYRWWIGADGRLYKMTLDVPAAARAILVEYDPNINIQPPIP